MIQNISFDNFLVNVNPFSDYETNINLYLENKVWGDAVPHTMLLLSSLSKNKTVFEFGTFRGQTTYNLSKTAIEVYTFDFGDNISGEGYPEYEVGEVYPEYEVGEVYKKNNATNVIQLVGDSMIYDFSELNNKFDIIWLDAGHSYKACKKDFETSLQIMKQDTTTIIAIDDYPAWAGVKQAVEEIAETKHLYYIPEIALIVYINKP
jgi:predicted O-methyltransferase YrrM